MANNPLVGAWELVSESDTGIIIYTGSHYAASLMPKDRQRSTRHETTPDEALDAMFAPAWPAPTLCPDRESPTSG